MASPACGLIAKNFRKLAKEIDSWVKNPRTKDYFSDPYEAALSLVERSFRMDLKTLSTLPGGEVTPGQVESFKARLNELSDAIRSERMDNDFAKLMYTTSTFAKRDPAISKLLNKMQESGAYFRESTHEDRTLFNEISQNIQEYLGVSGIMRKMGRVVTGKTAYNEFMKLEDSIGEALTDVKNRVPGSQDNVLKLLKQRDTYVDSNPELKIYDDLINIIENQIGSKNPDEPGLYQKRFNKLSKSKRKEVISKNKTIKLTEKDYGQIEIDGKKLNEMPIERSQPIIRALRAYTTLMDNLHSRMKNAVTAQVSAIVSRAQLKGSGTEASRIQEMEQNLLKKLLPDYEAGYFPHFVRDLNIGFMDGLMPHLDRIQKSSNNYIKNTESTLGEALDEANTYITKHTSKRSPSDYLYNRHFLNVVQTYMDNISSFNYNAFMNKHSMDALQMVERVYKKSNKSAEGYANDISEYILDLHSATQGNSGGSEATNKIVRTLLGFEFISKMGLNPRGAARNWFQRLLDYVEWGPVQVKKTNEILEQIELGKGIDSFEAFAESALKKAGLRYEETNPMLEESIGRKRASTMKSMYWDEASGKYKFSKITPIDKAMQAVSWVAGKSGVLHRKAENSNRKHTFKVAFAQMYRWLDANPRFESMHENRSASERSRRKLAKNFAINMVVMNHFDYADYAKAKGLRTNVGKILGQFQHYGFEMFGRNLEILRESKYDLKTGGMFNLKDAHGLQKAYRMSFIYFMAPAIAASLTGVDFSNLIEHDTSERLKQISALMTQDEEEMKQQFYGKGPILGTVGGPLVSDIVDIGIMLDFIDLDPESLLTIAMGLEHYDQPGVSDRNLAESIRILNTAAARNITRNIPQLAKGRLGWAVQQELGLYPTKEARQAQEKQRKLRKKTVPPELEKLLLSIEQGQLT